MRGGRIVRSPREAVEAWAAYRRNGDDSPGRLGPYDLARRSAKVGMGIPFGIAAFVEETPGFAAAEAALRRAHGLRESPGRVAAWPPLTVEAFLARLEERLPYEFLPPRRELCEAELEERLRRTEDEAQAAIDARFRARYPGMIRGGFGDG